MRIIILITTIALITIGDICAQYPEPKNPNEKVWIKIDNNEEVRKRVVPGEFTFFTLLNSGLKCTVSTTHLTNTVKTHPSRTLTKAEFDNISGTTIEDLINKCNDKTFDFYAYLRNPSLYILLKEGNIYKEYEVFISVPIEM